MGSSKNGGYQQVSTLNPQQLSALQKLLSQSQPLIDQSAQGFQQFLPGGQGLNAVETQANQNFQQNTVPNLLNSLGAGSNVKGSSGLNQALAGAAGNMNTDLAALRSQTGVSAAQGLGNLGLGGQGIGLRAEPFGITPKNMPFWQQLLMGGIGVGSRFI